jgi:hypothetical protein
MTKNLRHLYVSDEAYLKAERSQKRQQKQIVGYSKDDKFYRYSRDTYKISGIAICFLAWMVSYIDVPYGFILFGVGLLVYTSGPPQYAKTVYLCDTINWVASYNVLDYDENKCPYCKGYVEMETKIVTKCQTCNKKMCMFGAELRTT